MWAAWLYRESWPKRWTCTAFPFNQENLKGLRRTHAEFLADAKAAISEGKAVRGVKGSCWFAGLQYYDMVKGTAVD